VGLNVTDLGVAQAPFLSYVARLDPKSEKYEKVMKLSTYPMLVTAIALAILVTAGCKTNPDPTSVLESTTAKRDKEGPGSERLLPPARGAKAPLVVVTTFEDFECPYCSRVGPLSERVLETFPNDVQIQFRNYPLAFHPLAVPTARAAIAAGQQGKFWEMYDLLFKSQATWSKQHIEVEITKVEWAEDGETATITLNRGAPSCLMAVDGKSGTCKYNEAVACSSKLASECTGFGVRGSDTGRLGRRLLFKVTKVDENESTAVVAADKRLTTEFWEKKDLNNDGNDDGWEKKGLPTERLQRLVRAGDSVRIVRRGRTNDEAFTNTLVTMAEKLGLDVDKFKADLIPSDDGDSIKDRLNQDLAKAQRCGARGTPTILVNGLKVEKQLQDKSLTQVALRMIRDQIRRGMLLLDQGVDRADVPAKLTSENLSSEKLASWLIQDVPLGAKALSTTIPSRPQPKKILGDRTHLLDLKRAPRLGAARSPHTLTVFSDFECPYCSRMAKPLHDLAEMAPGKVAIHFKHFPLGFHRRAKPAAVASYCAQKQGKFWEYHDAIFANARNLSDDDLRGHAKTLALDLKGFDDCIASKEASDFVDEDMAEGKKAGVRGTPTVLIDGRLYQGDRSPQGLLRTIEQLESGTL
jgi:protein-disulfide isomerase